MSNTIAYFDHDLQRSIEAGSDPAWIEFYRSFWPNAVAIVGINENNQWQHYGIDRVVMLPNGRQLSIDEKIRRGEWCDFLCEEKHVYDDGRIKPGWTLDKEKRCDFIAYAMPDMGTCTLLPYELLRITAVQHAPSWKLVKPNPLKSCTNRGRNGAGWQTYNIAVSWDRLFSDMRSVMERLYGNGASLKLSSAITDGNQINFGFWKQNP